MSRASRQRVLVVGVGNPDRGDDGVGALVVERLAGRLPQAASLRTRSGDMLGLIDDCVGHDALICIDATAPMGAPGRLHRIDAAASELPYDASPASSHAFGLAEVISLARALNALPAQVVVYAVEGACFDAGATMTSAVVEAADDAAQRILEEVRRLAAMEQEESAHA